MGVAKFFFSLSFLGCIVSNSIHAMDEAFKPGFEWAHTCLALVDSQEILRFGRIAR